MSEWESTISVMGVKDLTDSLETVIKKYPESARICLRDEARRTRKEIVKNAKSMTHIHSKAKMSLGRVGSYRISPVRGEGTEQYVEITARARHFHLVEKGHTIKAQNKLVFASKKTGKKIVIRNKNAGQVKGKVAGKFFLQKAREEEAEHFPEFVDEMVDKLLREGSLL